MSVTYWPWEPEPDSAEAHQEGHDFHSLLEAVKVCVNQLRARMPRNHVCTRQRRPALSPRPRRGDGRGGRRPTSPNQPYPTPEPSRLAVELLTYLLRVSTYLPGRVGSGPRRRSNCDRQCERFDPTLQNTPQCC